MFVNKKYKDHESIRVEEVFINAIITILCVALFLMSALYIWPGDIVTSGLWWDNTLKLQPITTSSPTIPLAQYSVFLDVSFEGLVFAISLSFLQILFLYKTVTCGPWSQNYETTMQIVWGWLKATFSGNRWKEKINTEKMGYFSIFLVGMAIDVATDSLYRGSYGALGFWHFMGAVMVSLIFFNLLSEFLLTKMLVWSVNYGANTFYVLLGLISLSLQNGFKNMAHSSIDIGLPTDGSGSSNGNSKQSQPNSRKNRRGRDGKERIPHSGGAHAHQQRNRENSDLPEEFLRMMEESR
jgi:hypothetical protein